MRCNLTIADVRRPGHYRDLYNKWKLPALWLVVAHDLLEYRYIDDVTGDLISLFCSTWRAVLKMFVRLFLIKASENLEKRKMEKPRQKELLTTWEC